MQTRAYTDSFSFLGSVSHFLCTNFSFSSSSNFLQFPSSQHLIVSVYSCIDKGMCLFFLFNSVDCFVTLNAIQTNELEAFDFHNFTRFSSFTAMISSADLQDASVSIQCTVTIGRTDSVPGDSKIKLSLLEQRIKSRIFLACDHFTILTSSIETRQIDERLC